MGAFATSSAGNSPLTFETVIRGWLVEKKPNEKKGFWRRGREELSDFVGHDDARRVNAGNLVSWKADLLAKGRAAKTIRDSKLAPVRAIFPGAVDNRKLDTNPAARINIDLKSRSTEKRRGYTDGVMSAGVPIAYDFGAFTVQGNVDGSKL